MQISFSSKIKIKNKIIERKTELPDKEDKTETKFICFFFFNLSMKYMQEYYENETKAVTTNCDQNHQIIDRPLSSLTSQFTCIYEDFFNVHFSLKLASTMF